MSFPTTRRAVAGLVPAAALAAFVWLRPAAAPDPLPDAGPFVTPEVLAEALASPPPARPTMSDAIDHFEARLASRGDEAFSRRSLAGAHLLRFRAYGAGSDLDAAERHLRAAEAGGAGPQSAALRTAIHLARHEFVAALETARGASRAVQGTDPDLQYRVFDALWATGRAEEARALLTLPLDTASVDWMSRRARVLDAEGRVEAARDLFRRVVDRVEAYAEPAAVRAWASVELGHFEHHAGDPGRAVERYLAALRILPGSPAALEGLASIAAGVDRDPDVAATLVRRALAYGGHLDLVPFLADLEEERGDRREAERLRAAFVREVGADPASERLHRRPLARLLADRPEGSCRALAAARADFAERRDAGAWETLAWARFHTGDLAGAVVAAQAATVAGQPEPGVALRAGVILSAAHDAEAARPLLEVALDGASELSAAQISLAERVLRGGGAPSPARPSGCG